MTDKRKKLPTSALARLIKLGGLAGRVGVSSARETLRDALLSGGGRSRRPVTGEATRQAQQVAEVLGTLKGVPMKIGQMLSLHGDLLPTEVAEILRGLQQDAPAVSFGEIESFIQAELGGKTDMIDHLDADAWAAASIGQVHRGTLRDGRQVVFKVQYPGIDKVIAADMRTLKGPLNLLLGMFTEVDLVPFWEELADRLHEELDYETEAAHMERMAALWQTDSRIVIPEVLPALSTRHVLCMAYEPGVSAAWACSDTYTQQQRDQWGQVLLHIFLNGLFVHRFLHADPNLANFAFRPDGQVVVYDFGCVKVVPPAIGETYLQLTRAVLEGQFKELVPILDRAGIQRLDGQPVPQSMVDEYAALITEPFEVETAYRFGETRNIYEELITLGRKYWSIGVNLSLPRDILFIDRALAGHFGNLCRLRAAGPWREILMGYVSPKLTE